MVITAGSLDGSGKYVYTEGDKNTSSGCRATARVIRRMSLSRRRPAADAATTGASRRSTTIGRTFGAVMLNKSADFRSRKQMNSSSGARAAIALTISRVKRPYPRSFAQQVASIPMRTRSLEIGYFSRCGSRLQSPERFSKGPTCRKPENERTCHEKIRKLSGAAGHSTRAPRKKNEGDNGRHSDDSGRRGSSLANAPCTEMSPVREAMTRYQRERK